MLIGFIVFLSHEGVIPYLADKYLKDFDITYSKIEGTLLSGVKIYDASYKDIAKLKTLDLNYNFLELLRINPKITKLRIDSLHVDINKIPKSEKDDDKSSIIGFKILQLELNNSKVIYEEKKFEFDLKTQNFLFDDTLHVDKLVVNNALFKEGNLTLTFDLNSSNVNYNKVIGVDTLSANLISTYGEVKLLGKVTKNKLIADATLSKYEAVKKEYLDFLQGLPENLDIKLELKQENAVIGTFLNKVSLKKDENLSIKNADIRLEYFIKDKNFKADVNYMFSYQNYEAITKQSLLFTDQGTYKSKLDATLSKHPIKLPFQTFSIDFFGDSKSIVADINSSNINLSVIGKDYEHFDIRGKGDDISLSFLEDIPLILQKNIVSFKMQTVMDISPFSLVGSFQSEGLYSNTNGTLDFNNKSLHYQGSLNLKPQSELFEDYPVKRISPINLFLFSSKDIHLLNIDMSLANISLFKNEDKLNGWGNVSSSNFDISGSLKDETGAKSLTLNANIASLNTLVKELDLKHFDKFIFYDAEVNVESTLKFNDKFEIKSQIDIPWYVFQTDSQTAYSGVESFVQIKSIDKEIFIDSYNVEVMNQKLYSQKDSKILLEKDGDISIKELWIYDNLLVTGLISPVNKKANIHLTSDRFTYDGKEGNITAKVDINAIFNDNGEQSFEGGLTFIDGIIKYMPAQDYSVTDEDIIIIQDIQEESELNRFINIRIDSLKPIKYKIENVDISFRPDITIFQERKMPLTLLGVVDVDKGKVEGAEKSFELKKSEVYFYGENYLNPYLNLNLHHYTLNYIDIEIFVTNTLDSPVVIFSSNPSMSQNDIMSYLLFGQPASSVFDGEGGNNKIYINSFLLGTGLKKIFNETSAIKIDTLNILNNKSGTLGYEIGSRISKEFRIIYKNDTVSSVIVQYSMNKSTRIDVDVQETGQGVSLIYVNDF